MSVILVGSAVPSPAVASDTPLQNREQPQEEAPAKPNTPAPAETARSVSAGISPTAISGADSNQLAAQWAQMNPDDVLEDAVRRREMGDQQGALQRLDWLQSSAPSAEQAYQAAIIAEIQGRYADALDGYTRILADWGDSARALDATFRRVLVLEDLGQHRAALREVKQLQRADTWSPRDALSLNLTRGVSELRQGHARRGLRRIARALDSLAGEQTHSWLESRARAARLQHTLAQAQSVALVHGRRATKRLAARAHALKSAEQEVIAIATLGEPEYALLGLLALGDGYLQLHDDLAALPPPRSLDDTQRQQYMDALGQRIAVLRRKAWRYYDEGVRVSLRTNWQGSITQQLEARRDSLDLSYP